MAQLRWSGRPTGDRPVLIAAFEGWNDAADAATTAVDHLVRHWDAEIIADLDPEDFYDFTSTRPVVHLGSDSTRSVKWPTNTFSWARPAGTGGVVLLSGTEPQLKWRTFCDRVLEVARTLDCSMVLTLGALLAEVAHSRPTPVFGTGYDPAVIERLGVEPSRYEGPTGIVGVLHDQCLTAGVDSASLWAAVPSYVPSAPSAKAALALVERTTDLLDATVPNMDLRFEATAYEHEISQLVLEDEATADYVRHLEEQFDNDAQAVQSADDMVEELEQFLREQ